MNNNQHIINHLFEFLNFISKNITSTFVSEENFKAISHQHSSWPNFIYDIQPGISIKKISLKIANNQLPPHLILNATQLDEYENELTINGFLPIAEWACLELNQNPLKTPQNQQLNIKKITTKNDLKIWTKVASSGFGTIDFSVFENLINNSAIEFYGGFKNNKLIATAMLFYNNNTAGIYHVVTLPKHQKRGFGSAIFQHCQNMAIKNNYNQVIAQSTQEGLNAWIKTGMKQYGNFYLLCSNKSNK